MTVLRTRPDSTTLGGQVAHFWSTCLACNKSCKAGMNLTMLAMPACSTPSMAQSSFRQVLMLDLLQHLIHTWAVHKATLCAWQDYSVSFSRRPDIQALIGKEAEFLVHTFCTMDLRSLDATMDAPSGKHFVLARKQHGGHEIPLTDQQYQDLITVQLADWLEQVALLVAATRRLFLASSVASPDFASGPRQVYSNQSIDAMIDAHLPSCHDLQVCCACCMACQIAACTCMQSCCACNFVLLHGILGSSSLKLHHKAPRPSTGSTGLLCCSPLK